MGKFINGVTTGAIIGAAVGMMVMPQLDRSTRRKIVKSGRMIKNVAGDAIDNIMHMM